jgi:hypothetical protein
MSNERRGRLGCLWRRSSRVAPFLLLFVGASNVSEEGAGLRTEGGAALDLGPPSAHGDVNWGYDADLDGLPDEVELLVGGAPFLADTDGDGFSDAIEFVCG